MQQNIFFLPSPGEQSVYQHIGFPVWGAQVYAGQRSLLTHGPHVGGGTNFLFGFSKMKMLGSFKY